MDLVNKDVRGRWKLATSTRLIGRGLFVVVRRGHKNIIWGNESVDREKGKQ
jgi:hypothetical protein